MLANPPNRKSVIHATRNLPPFMNTTKVCCVIRNYLLATRNSSTKSWSAAMQTKRGRYRWQLRLRWRRHRQQWTPNFWRAARMNWCHRKSPRNTWKRSLNWITAPSSSTTNQWSNSGRLIWNVARAKHKATHRSGNLSNWTVICAQTNRTVSTHSKSCSCISRRSTKRVAMSSVVIGKFIAKIEYSITSQITWIRMRSSKWLRRLWEYFRLFSFVFYRIGRCPICNQISKSKILLRIHMKQHLPSEDRPFHCSKCPQKFVLKSQLTNHEATHLSNEEKRYVCDECGKA